MSTSGDWPFYIDDPLVDRSQHRLELHMDPKGNGLGYCFGECSCGEFVTPTWDEQAVFGAFDDHMALVQASAHAAAEGKADNDRTP